MADNHSQHIDVTGITKSFRGQHKPVPVFEKLNLRLAIGSTIAVLGTSGTGKTTLLRLIAGLEQPDSGNIAVPAEARPVRMLFQSDVLLPWRTVLRNVSLAADLTGKASLRAAAGSNLRRVGLHDVANAYPAQLSGGMRRRVSLAAVLTSDFRTVLLDEPLGGVDLPQRVRLLVWLRSMLKDAASTCIIATHDIEDAIQLADRVIVLGGTPAQLIADHNVTIPRHDSIEAAWRLRRMPEFVALAERLAQSLDGGVQP